MLVTDALPMEASRIHVFFFLKSEVFFPLRPNKATKKRGNLFVQIQAADRSDLCLPKSLSVEEGVAGRWTSQRTSTKTAAWLGMSWVS